MAATLYLSAMKFKWDLNIGNAEHSELGAIGDIFMVYSPKTGVTVQFDYDHDEKDGEGEVQAFVYTSRRGDYRIRVFND